MRAPLLLLLIALPVWSEVVPVEVHQRLSATRPEDTVVALTLDACDDGYDNELVRFLVDRRIPATVFVTRRWMRHQPAGFAELLAHPELFDIEDHGNRHVPAVLGPGRMLYGMHGNADADHLKDEVVRGAQAIEQATGTRPHWYRGATGLYDPQAVTIITGLGYRIAGFSVNADNGARLSKRQIVQRLERVQSGDIIIAHVNRPDSDTAEGLAVGLKQLLDRGFHFVKLNTVTVRPMQKRRS
jgi:peptidoglycan/xylan/chitin deacetylase (PgdA/CDA1 family)